MFDPDKHFLVATKKAANSTGKSEQEIQNRICAGTLSIETKDWFPGQKTTIEDDGQFLWVVTRSEKLAPDGKKLMAYVVDGSRKRYTNSMTPDL